MCARVFALRNDYSTTSKAVRFTTEILSFRKRFSIYPVPATPIQGFSHPVLSLKPDFSGQDIQELREIKDTIKELLRSAPPAEK
jgi:hypothetical protein